MLVPGVLNGSQGALLYRLQDLKATAPAWNGMPLTYGHPKASTARSPIIQSKYGLGHVYNVHADKDLRGEAWIDVDKANRIDNRIVSLVESGAKVELSTGVYVDSDPTPGVHNGERYDAITSNHRPDHLALLLDVKGACSVADGCGVNNHGDPKDKNYPHGGGAKGVGAAAKPKAKKKKKKKRPSKLTIADAEKGLAEKGMKLEGVLPFDMKNMTAMYKVRGKDGKSKAMTSAQVKDLISNSKSDNQLILNKEKAMPLTTERRGEIVSTLVENCDCWTEKDEATLNEFSDKVLSTLEQAYKSTTALAENATTIEDLTAKLEASRAETEAVANALPPEFMKKKKGKKDEEEENEENEEGGKAKKANNAIKLEDLPADLQEDITFARNAKQARKDTLIARLVANRKNEDKAARSEALNKLSLNELEDRVADLPEESVDNSSATVSSYVGAAAPVKNRAEPFKPEPLPVYNWDNFYSPKK